MSDEGQAVIAATQRLYDGIEAMIAGEGPGKIKDAWHHTDRVTIRHPMGDWSVGWEEVWATWSVTATFGRPDRGGSKVLEIVPYVYGELAYATVVFQASPAWGGEQMGCTNVLLKQDGEWKVIHHHAGPSPAMQTALERMLAES